MTVIDDPPGPAPAEVPDYTSYSALTLHRKCPQAWSYRQLRRLGPADDSATIDRDLGSWWHALRSCDAIERGVAHGSLRYVPGEIGTGDTGPKLNRVHLSPDTAPLYQIGDNPQQQFAPSVKLVLALAKAWRRTLDADTRDAWDERLGGATLAEHLAAMENRWRARWPETPGEQPIGVEVEWRRELGDTGTMIGGKVDEVYFDTKRGLIVVRDHKTNRTLGPEVEDDFMDSQLHLYGWGVDPMVVEWTGGRHVSALAYDRARSVPPKQPQVTKSGTLSKSVTDYDVETYRTFAAGPDGAGVPFPGLKKDGSGAGVYEADPKVIEKLSTPQALNQWNQRTLVPLNDNVTEVHLQAAVDSQQASLQTVDRFNRSGQAPRNLTRLGCKWCDWQQLCRAEMIAGPRNDFDPAEFGLRQLDS